MRRKDIQVPLIYFNFQALRPSDQITGGHSKTSIPEALAWALSTGRKFGYWAYLGSTHEPVGWCVDLTLSWEGREVGYRPEFVAAVFWRKRDEQDQQTCPPECE